MSKIVVKGNSVTDILHSLGRQQAQADILLSLRSEPFTTLGHPRPFLPGLKIVVAEDRFLCREFTTLEESISWIRKIYREAHARARANCRPPTAK